MKKVSVIGHFAVGRQYLNGQTIKTKIVAGELERVLPAAVTSSNAALVLTGG